MIENEDDMDSSELYGGGRNGMKGSGFERYDYESGGGGESAKPFKDESESNIKFTKSLLQKRKGKGFFFIFKMIQTRKKINV